MTATTLHEHSAWMRARLAKVTASARRQVAAAGVDLDDESCPSIVVHPLGRNGQPGSRQDRSCDRCGTHVPPPGRLHMFTIRPEAWLLVTGGLCTRCWSAEAGGDQ